MERRLEAKEVTAKSSAARVMGVKKTNERTPPLHLVIHHPRSSSMTPTRRREDLAVSKPRYREVEKTRGRRKISSSNPIQRNL